MAQVRWVSVAGAIVIGAITLLSTSSARSAPTAAPTARVGAVYFDGWACSLSNFHFDGLVRPGPNGAFPGRRPLSGWRDETLDTLTAQLKWAKAAGIGFFLFDWYREDIDPCLNVAHDNYLKLADHHDVGLAILYVNHEPFGISMDQWGSTVERWVTRDFANPDYVRVAGKPLFVVLDTTTARQQWGGSAGVNRALGMLRAAAQRHGLPGVFVVGGRYTDWLNISCFPTCEGTDGGVQGLRTETYDALTEYGYSLAVEPIDGPRPYDQLVAAKRRDWQVFAQASAVPYIPSISGWDARPWDSRPLERLFWFERKPKAFGTFLNDAITWVQTNPGMHLERGAAATPLVLIQSWNELGEGSYVVPTDGDGYGYVQAVARAVGVPWTPPPRRTLRVLTSTRGKVMSSPSGITCPPRCSAAFDEGTEVTLTVRPVPGSTFDGWRSRCSDDDPALTCSKVLLEDSILTARVTASYQRRLVTFTVVGRAAKGRLTVLDGYGGCASDEPVLIQHRRGARWITVGSARTDRRGKYAVSVGPTRGRYRAIVPRRSLGPHTCAAAASATITR